MKILILSHRFSPDIGGIEVNAEIYARAFALAGHEIHLLTWSSTDTKAVFPFTIIRNPSVKALFQEHAWADMVFENNPCIRLAWPGMFFGRPSVISLNTMLRQFHPSAWAKKAWLGRAHSVISVSDAVREACWPAATVIGNPYRADTFRILPGVARTSNFVFLGRLVSQKGANQAILAFNQVLDLLREKGETSGPSLTIIGDGPERGNLEKLVNSLSLNAQVTFAGFLHGHELARQLNRFRYMLVPSLHDEAFGNVVLEGMACGCVPIVSDSGGLPAAVGNAGLVYRQGDVAALAASIWQLLHDPELEDRLRQAADAHLAAHAPEMVTQRYLRLLEAAANRAKQPAASAG